MHLLIISGILSLGSLAYLIWLWRKRLVETSQSFFTLADAVLAALIVAGLGMIMLLNFVLMLRQDSSQEAVSFTLGGVVFAVIFYIATYGTAAAFICIWMVVREINPWQAFGLHRLDWRMLGTAFGCFLAGLALVIFAQELLEQLAGKFPLQPLVIFWIENDGWLDRTVVAVFAVVVAPVFEEIVFRGYFYGILKRYTGIVAAAIIVSAFFAVVHMHWPALPGLFIVGMVFTFAYERSGSLTAPIVCHALFNTASLIGALLFPDRII